MKRESCVSALCARVKDAPKVGGQLAPTMEREDLLISHACA